VIYNNQSYYDTLTRIHLTKYALKLCNASDNLKGLNPMNELNLKTALTVFILSIISVLSSPALARDINVEQHNASEARKEYNNAKDNYDSITKQISTIEQHIAEQQAKLDQLKNEQANAQTNVDNAKVNLDQKVEILERAWEERNK
jgi:peptidoglycan hydrolase CwlO-like protein